MNEKASGSEFLRAVMVLAATVGTIAFNWMAAVGRVNGITPEVISDKYPTMITPAGYAFSIWSLIYLGMIAFSIYQMLPTNIARFRNVRSLYIFSSVLNCAWIYFWHQDQIAVCLVIIVAFCSTLFLINVKLASPSSNFDALLTKAPFGIYFGWVTAATLVNFAVLLSYLNVTFSTTGRTVTGVILIVLAAVMGVIIRLKLTNYFYPLAIAWALTAIGVKQSGQSTLIVLATAFGVIACLLASLSFVMTLNSSISEQK